MKRVVFLVCLVIVSIAVSCKKEKQENAADLLKAEENELFSGGIMSTSDHGKNAYTHAPGGLKSMDHARFFIGNSFFNQNWVSAPASTQARDGLGPFFNARSCSACHFKDGRGRPAQSVQELPTGFLIRLSIPGEGRNGEPVGDPIYGGQLNERSINGLEGEGAFTVQHQLIQGEYDDGTPYTLSKPIYELSDLKYGNTDSELMLSPRIGQQMIGLGLLEAIKEADLLLKEDVNDRNNDGISGKANRVWDVENGESRIGRFGWKANQPSLRQQVAGAFLGDLGITSSIFPNENCSAMDCSSIPNGGQHEIDESNLNAVVFYSSILLVPTRRDVDKQSVLEGKEIFKQIGCEGCHTQSFTTGSHSIEILSDQKIWPYTDLLLHDMGKQLSDGRPDFNASEQEWRTPPLWGIGLFQSVNGHTNYLHDGRANSIEEAVLWHGGEAEKSVSKFKKLNSNERNVLLEFLQSL